MDRALAWVLLLYPRQMRRRYGPEIAELTRDLIRLEDRSSVRLLVSLAVHGLRLSHGLVRPGSRRDRRCRDDIGRMRGARQHGGGEREARRSDPSPGKDGAARGGAGTGNCEKGELAGLAPQLCQSKPSEAARGAPLAHKLLEGGIVARRIEVGVAGGE